MPETKQTAEATTEQLCRLFDLTAARIGQLRKDGIIYKTGRNTFDLWKSVKGYITYLQKTKVDGAKNIEKTGAIGDPQELEELVRQVKAARTYNDARTLKVQIDALRAGYALEVEQENYCSINEIMDAMTGIAATVRAAIMRMEADLPPMLEGMNAATMQKVIREKVDGIMQIIHDAGDKLKNGKQKQIQDS